MKITDVETFVVGTEWRNLTIVRVHADEGLTEGARTGASR